MSDLSTIRIRMGDTEVTKSDAVHAMMLSLQWYCCSNKEGIYTVWKSELIVNFILNYIKMAK